MRLVCLLLLIFASTFFAAFPTADADDEAALLAFKAAAIGGNSSALASWNGSTNGGYCSWDGVRCRGNNRQVVMLSLTISWSRRRPVTCRWKPIILEDS
jgi:hypothetical protein